MMGLSYTASHFLLGPALRRRDSGFREHLVFGTFIYLYLHHHIDSRQVPCEYMDELFTQETPNGDYLRVTMEQNMPNLWSDIRAQLEKKGYTVKNSV
jgi:hypothetical protein